jgi:hypothetical protein
MRRTPLACTLGLAFLTGGAFAAEVKVETRPAAPAPAAPAPAAPSGPAPAAPAPAPADEPLPETAPASEDAQGPVPPDEAADGPAAAPGSKVPLVALAPGAWPTKGPEKDRGPTVGLPRDTLGGHISVGAAVSLFVPFGSFQTDLPQSTLLDPGVGFRLDAAYGVSRTVMVGLYGELSLPDGSSTWGGTKAQSIAVGPFVRYHLVQGVRFDPWIGFGAGFRRTGSGDQSYTGFDFARIQLGGDFYGLSNMGFGPLIEFAMGTFVGAEGVNMGGKTVNAHFTLGARFTFDGPGK